MWNVTLLTSSQPKVPIRCPIQRKAASESQRASPTVGKAPKGLGDGKGCSRRRQAAHSTPRPREWHTALEGGMALGGG